MRHEQCVGHFIPKIAEIDTPGNKQPQSRQNFTITQNEVHMGFLSPQRKISPPELEQGMRMLLVDGVSSQIMGVVTGGAFLVAFALLLGATSFQVGLIAALAPFSQIVQIPAIFLIRRVRQRKRVAVVSAFCSRMFWFVAASLPWLMPGETASSILFFSLFMYFSLGTVAALSYQSWMRDLIPEHRRGIHSANRMILSTLAGSLFGMGAGYGVDHLKPLFSELPVYSGMFILGGVLGLAGVWALSRIPEPKMPPPEHIGWTATLRKPFSDQNFRQLLVFLASWNFAVNLAAPFFTVYMLNRLHLNMTLIMALAMVSQVANMLFARLWGMLADRFSNRSVLMESGPILIFTMLIWPFTSMPDNYLLTIPLLITIHALSGISSSGVNLASSNIAMKLAPKGEATQFLAVRSMVSGIAAMLGPIVGGTLATLAADISLTLTFDLKSAENALLHFPTINLSGLDFIFILSFLLGSHALHRLITIQELGTVDKETVREGFQFEVRKFARNISNIAGLRNLFYFPYAALQVKRMAGQEESQTSLRSKGVDV
ncbi:MAG: MFS transporter [Magnetococcales bacterium]|nr:MFS transporter [Magnetococcales bacterium]